MSVRKKASLPTLVLWGVATAAALTLLFILPAALLLHKQLVQEAMGGLLTALSAGLALLVSVVVFARNYKTAPIVGGLVLAAYLVLVCLVGLCLCGGEIWGEGLIRQCLAAVAGTAIGIMVSLRKRPHRKRYGGR